MIWNPSEVELEVHDLTLKQGRGQCLSRRLCHYQFLEAHRYDEKVMLPETLGKKQEKIAGLGYGRQWGSGSW